MSEQVSLAHSYEVTKFKLNFCPAKVESSLRGNALAEQPLHSGCARYFVTSVPHCFQGDSRTALEQEP
jgi:hypothetical protein